MKCGLAGRTRMAGNDAARRRPETVRRQAISASAWTRST
jgi:hypothetical protein